jgi:hypothetical protein
MPKRFKALDEPHQPVPITQPLHVMSPLPPTPELLDVARRIVWFKDPAEALANPIELLAYAMTHCADEYMALLMAHVGRDGLAEVLAHAPPGIIDPPSRAYWTLRLNAADLPSSDQGSSR